MRRVKMPASLKMYVIREDQMSGVWGESCSITLNRVPMVGEFIDIFSSMNRLDDDWYKVVMVVHTPAEPNCDACVFVEAINYHVAFPADESDGEIVT
jgi:hypothetical protein